jgi:flagellar biogenesis protein FliO
LRTATDRRRLWFIAGGGVLLLLAFLFISAFAPNPHPGATEPVVRTADNTSVPLTSSSQSAPAAKAEKSSGGFSFGGGDAVSLVWRLVLVAVVIGVAIVALRWWGRRQASPRSMTGFLRVVDTLAISNGRSIHLVALGDRVIAVGATTQQISMLDQLTDDEARQVLDESTRPQAQPLANFATELFESLRNGRPWRGHEQDAVIGEELA